MILVTGGTGLVGSHLLFRLCSSGKKVRALKRESSSLNLLKKTFSYYSTEPDTLLSKIEWVNGDVTDIYSLYEAMEGIEQVYHTAAIVSFHASESNEMMKVNIDGTANIVNACLYIGVKKLCHVSSIATLGRADNDGLTDEETHWKSSKMNSSYSISKYGAEREVWRGITEGLPAVIVNPSVIIGPGNWNSGSCQMFQQSWNGLKFYTEGVNGYVDVKDVAKAMIMLMESDIINSRFIVSSENLNYQTFFSMVAERLGKKKPSIKATAFLSQLAWRAEKLKSLATNKKPLITKETARTAFQKFYYSNEKIKKTLGFEFVPMNTSIKQTCDFFLKDNK
jgi:dihydroflavonol-4-reductase